MTAGPSEEPFPSHPRLMFMGTPEFALPTLEALIDSGNEILAVITQPDRPKGRGKRMAAPPVKLLAAKNDLEVMQPERATEVDFLGRVEAKDPDLIVVVAYGQILKKRLLELPAWGVINIHASLLPKYRGAAPIQAAVLNNEPKTGLTIMRVEERLDAGPILFQRELPILKDETAGQLHDKLAREAGDLIAKSLKEMAGNRLSARDQDDSAATWAPKIDKQLSLIDWRKSASEVSAHIRALDPTPGARTTWQGKELKFSSSTVRIENRSNVTPGRVAGFEKGCLVVETGKGTVGIGQIQYPGKRKLSAADFLRGFSLPRGTLLGE